MLPAGYPESIVPEMHLLLSMLQVAPIEKIRENFKTLTANELDWKLFNKLTVMHAVCPRISDLLQKVVDNNTQIGKACALIHKEAAVVKRRNLMLVSEMVKMQAAFREERIPFVILKGPVIALQFFDSLVGRGFRDIDILVRRQDLAASCKLLERLRYEHSWRHELSESFAGNDYALVRGVFLHAEHEVEFVGHNNGLLRCELHWKVLPDNLYFEQLEPFVREAALGSQVIETISPEAHFVITCAHAGKHQWMKLTWLVDVAVMLERAQLLDWNEVYRVARDFGYVKITRASIQLACELLGAPAPPQAQLAEPLDAAADGELRKDQQNMLSLKPSLNGFRESLQRAWLFNDSTWQSIKHVARIVTLPDFRVLPKSQLSPVPFFLYSVCSGGIVIGRMVAGRLKGSSVQR